MALSEKSFYFFLLCNRTNFLVSALRCRVFESFSAFIGVYLDNDLYNIMFPHRAAFDTSGKGSTIPEGRGYVSMANKFKVQGFS